jgi:hypothetical protein
MADGHLNICKKCTKERVGNHRGKNIEKIREYDRGRGKLPHRRELARKSVVKYRSENRSNKFWLGNALRDGRIFKPIFCYYCSSDRQIEGHHQDYSIKEMVFWMCSACHKQLHHGKSEKSELLRNYVYALEEDMKVFKKWILTLKKPIFNLG